MREKLSKSKGKKIDPRRLAMSRKRINITMREKIRGFRTAVHKSLDDAGKLIINH